MLFCDITKSRSIYNFDKILVLVFKNLNLTAAGKHMVKACILLHQPASHLTVDKLLVTFFCTLLLGALNTHWLFTKEENIQKNHTKFQNTHYTSLSSCIKMPYIGEYFWLIPLLFFSLSIFTFLLFKHHTPTYFLFSKTWKYALFVLSMVNKVSVKAFLVKEICKFILVFFPLFHIIPAVGQQLMKGLSDSSLYG